MPPLIIGIDGGGTKTIAWLAPLDDPSNTIILGRGQAGPGNPRAAGFDVAQQNIAAAIESAFADAKLPVTCAAAACFGLAGAGRDIEQRQIEAWATNTGIAHMVRVTDDAEPILAAAAPDNCGIALISGTGSLAWGRNAAGQVARCGGWGYLLGDEGSAYAIARAGLTAAMRASDSRGPLTALLPRFQAALGAATAPEIIDRVYSPQMTREHLAGMAHIVFDAATLDPTAAQIVADAARQLAEMVIVLRRQLALPPRYTLALTGGVLLNELLIRMQFLDQLERDAPPTNTTLIFDPVLGALSLARRLATPTSLE